MKTPSRDTPSALCQKKRDKKCMDIDFDGLNLK